MSAQVAADLRAAADVLERDGWTRRLLHAEDGCHCALGALDIAVGYPAWSENSGEREDAALRVLTSVTGSTSLIGWNDAPGRTADEVIAALRAAADRAEADQ